MHAWRLEPVGYFARFATSVKGLSYVALISDALGSLDRQVHMSGLLARPP
jgi:hypothetical protein